MEFPLDCLCLWAEEVSPCLHEGEGVPAGPVSVWMGEEVVVGGPHLIECVSVRKTCEGLEGHRRKCCQTESGFHLLVSPLQLWVGNKKKQLKIQIIK